MVERLIDFLAAPAGETKEGSLVRREAQWESGRQADRPMRQEQRGRESVEPGNRS